MDLLKILDTKPVPSIVDSQTLGASGDVSGDYWLPTTMRLYQKELTDQIVSLHYSDILRYFETSDYKEDVVLESMRTMCKNSELVATHPYLLIDHYLPKSLITKDIPAHLMETSGKFVVLRDLINLVQKYETNTAIICKPGRTMDLIEALLLGNKVNIKRYDGSSVKSKQKKPKSYSCTCHIVPSTDYDSKKYPLNVPDQFDMVICIDPSVDTESVHVQKILKHSRPQKGRNSRAPIVRLITINSVDHCNIFFGKNFDKGSTAFLERVTAAVVVLRDRVGTLPPDLRPIYSQHLSYLTEWLEDPTIAWPLPDVYPIKEYNSMDVERSLLSEVKFSQMEDMDAIFNINPKKRERNRDRNEDGSYNTQGNGEKKSYYELKRLKNNYSTNPTKQGLKQLTGITTAGEDDSVNYHLVSGILTHKLIQSIGQVYIDIKRQVAEINDYDSMNNLENDHVLFYTGERDSMQKKLQDQNDLIEKYNKNSKDLETPNNKSFEMVQEMETRYANLLNKMQCNGKLDQKLKELFVKKNQIKEELTKEEGHLESKIKEKEYMDKEIGRANEAIKVASGEINKLNGESKVLEAAIKEKFSMDNLKQDGVNQRIEQLKQELKDKEKDHDKLEAKLSELVEKLHQVPTPRIRTSNTSKSRSRRK